MIANWLIAGFALAASAATWGAGPALSAPEVEAWFDQAWSDTIGKDGIVPGAVITVVHDGEVLLNKGYGTSDRQSGAATDPNRTRVRIGSTSKLFTALTTLALVDQGKLDLDTDVNQYLTIAQVPDTFEDPVTVRTLLSHLSGFDSSISGYMVADNNNIDIDPAEYQRRLIRVRPPGREYGYDNMGLGLLGQVAAEVSGSTFADAVEAQVLRPLGMQNTAMGVPDRQLADLAACNTWDDAGNLANCQPKFMRKVYQGAGDISSTGADMARFMLALLNDGCLDGNCLLQPSTWDRFTDMGMNRMHPRAAGMGFILYEKNVAGHFAYGHDGGQDGFSTTMTLLPDQNVGIFISQFSYPGIPAEGGLSFMLDSFRRFPLHNLYGNAAETIESFARQFLPAPPVRTSPPSEPVPLDALAGNYLDTRGVGPSLLDRFVQVASAVAVEVKGDTVMIGGKGPYRQTEPGVLTAEGEEVAWYPTIRGGDVFLQYTNSAAVSMLVQKPWHMNARWTVLPLLLPILLGLAGGVFALVQRGAPHARRLGVVVLFTGAALALGLYLEFEYFSRAYFPDGPTAALFGWRLLLNLAWVAAAISLYLVITQRGMLFGTSGVRAVGRSVLVGLFALSSLVVLVLLPYWGLLGNFTAPP